MISAYGTVNIYDDAVLTSTAQALKIEETGKYTYTVVMPRRDITVRGYAHEHQYEYTVDGAQVIRTCTLEDGERNGDCEPAVMTLISNDWDNGPIASESVVFNPMGTVGVWLTDWSDGSWIDFYQVDEDGNETPYDYYDLTEHLSASIRL